MIVNEPPSDDEKFFKGKALTYYGRWTYKYEEAARRGAVGVLLIHRTDLAAYGWEVVRNSQAVEKSYLAGRPLRRSARRRLDSARCCPAALQAGRPRRSRPGHRRTPASRARFMPSNSRSGSRAISRAASAAMPAPTSWAACPA